MIDCFVSFCGIDAADAHVKILVEELQKRTEGAVRYHLYFEEDYGSSLENFMTETLRASQAILFLLGPGYKERTDKPIEKSGAYQEFDCYIHRIERTREYRPPLVIPVWWAGPSVESAFPMILQPPNPYACDLHEFRASGVSQNEPFLSKSMKTRYLGTIDKVAEQLKRHAENLAKEVADARLKTFSTLLLPESGAARDNIRTVEQVLEFKFEHGLYDAVEFKERYFTKTRFFRRIQDRNVGLISGRKGSGKTTLVQIRELDAETNQFYPVIDVEVERWNLHYLIQNNAFKQAEGDFEYLDVEARFFDYVWAVYVSLCMCVSLINDNGNSVKSAASMLGSTPVAATLDSLVVSAPDLSNFDYASLFNLAVSATRSFIQSVVDSAPHNSEDEFRQYVVGKVSTEGLMEGLYGKRMSRLQTLLSADPMRRFLFCFDRFDTELQRYRKEYRDQSSAEHSVRAKREVDWLSSLTYFVDRTLRPDHLAPDAWVYRFFSVVKFVVVLPHDRVMELRQSQRDSVAGEKVEDIHWQAKELLTMLRKRIQVLRELPDEKIRKDRSNSPLDRFEQCLKEAKIALPRTIQVRIGQRTFEMDLFLYVLRHTFFRPRDVLIHYSSILAHCLALEERGRKPSEDVIKESVASETHTIVDFEFIGELEDSWLNIREVLRAFKGANQSMSARDLENIVGPTKFVFYDGSTTISTFAKKVAFLYDLGFIGYRSPRAAGGGDNRDFRFVFLENSHSPPFDNERILRTLEFGIHPIFIESLFLVANGDEPVLNLTWEWIDRIDRVD